MANGRTPLYLALVALTLFGGAMLVVQPYSADWPGTAYSEPARRYLRAAIREDSVGLAHLSAAPAPVNWALDAARRNRHTLELWKRRVRAFIGERRGDTVEVYVYPPGDECAEAPIVLRFIGVGRDARVLKAGSVCMDR